MVAAQVQGRLPAEPFEVTALAVAGGNAPFNSLEPSSLRQLACSPNGDASVSLKVRHLVSRHGLDVQKSG